MKPTLITVTLSVLVLAALFHNRLVDRAAAQGQVIQNPRWEYLVHQEVNAVGVAALNNFGAEGWELVSSTTAGQLDRRVEFTHIFKRQRP